MNLIAQVQRCAPQKYRLRLGFVEGQARELRDELDFWVLVQIMRRYHEGEQLRRRNEMQEIYG